MPYFKATLEFLHNLLYLSEDAQITKVEFLPDKEQIKITFHEPEISEKVGNNECVPMYETMNGIQFVGWHLK